RPLPGGSESRKRPSRFNERRTTSSERSVENSTGTRTREREPQAGGQRAKEAASRLKTKSGTGEGAYGVAALDEQHLQANSLMGIVSRGSPLTRSGPCATPWSSSLF